MEHTLLKVKPYSVVLYVVKGAPTTTYSQSYFQYGILYRMSRSYTGVNIIWYRLSLVCSLSSVI